MTELSFLIELLLNHDLPKATKDLLAERIKEVEHNLTTMRIGSPAAPQIIVSSGTNQPTQAASTLAAMARHGGLVPNLPAPQEIAPEPVAVIAQTPQTAAAMNRRNEVIAEALSGKVDKTSGRPRKW